QDSLVDSIKKHPMVENIEIKRKLPQTVQVNVVEHNIVGYIKKDLAFHPVLENGMIITTDDIANKGDGPLLNNFDDEQYLQRIATELSKLPSDVFNLIS